MSNECWKEFKGWCKAFLLTEILLALLEAFLLILCIGFMVFLIMHMMVCQTWTSDISHVDTNDTTTKPPYDPVTEPNDNSTTGSDEQQTADSDRGTKSTLDPEITCSWIPSSKTTAASRYYEQTSTATQRRAEGESAFRRNASDTLKLKYSPTMNMTYSVAQLEQQLEGIDRLALDDESDGEEGAGAGAVAGGALLALVRPARAGGRGAFGCALAAVSPHWLLTAASCIAAIEEVDSLDEYVIAEGGRGRGRGRRYGVGDVQLHPLWQGANRSYDCAALRAEPPLPSAITPLALPALPDYFLLTLGERLAILGFGPFRSTEPTSEEREVRAVSVYSLPPALCREPESLDDGLDAAEGEDGLGGGWAPRHLSRGREEPHGNGGCGAAMVCAGVRWARGAGAGAGGGACGYCAGTPLVRGGVLLGLMAGAGAGRACARDCAPATYVNLALLRDWIDVVLAPD